MRVRWRNVARTSRRPGPHSPRCRSGSPSGQRSATSTRSKRARSWDSPPRLSFRLPSKRYSLERAAGVPHNHPISCASQNRDQMSDFATDYVNTRTSKFHRRSALRPHSRGAAQTSVIKIDGKEFLADGYHMYGRREIYEAVQITEQACELNFG